ncbi:MAG: hypothetical protein KGI06_03035 [Candidatus Micrarchaeota archaeon]|nr:hypothetical protein [Candidatus Micrarchaeota archaeon]
MRKSVSISLEIDKAIKEVKEKEGGRSISYSKALNYLVALGIDRYNDIFKNAKIQKPKYDHDKYKRGNY